MVVGKSDKIFNKSSLPEKHIHIHVGIMRFSHSESKNLKHPEKWLNFFFTLIYTNTSVDDSTRKL